MNFILLFVVAIAVTVSQAADHCKCVNVDQKIDPVYNPIIFFQHPTVTGEMNGLLEFEIFIDWELFISGVPCSSNCILQAHLDVDDEKYALEVSTHFPVTKNEPLADLTAINNATFMIICFQVQLLSNDLKEGKLLIKGLSEEVT